MDGGRDASVERVPDGVSDRRHVQAHEIGLLFVDDDAGFVLARLEVVRDVPGALDTGEVGPDVVGDGTQNCELVAAR